MIRGSYSRLTTGGPMAYWEWSWLGIDFIREAGSGRSGTSAICGRSTAPAAIPMWGRSTLTRPGPSLPRRRS